MTEGSIYARIALVVVEIFKRLLKFFYNPKVGSESVASGEGFVMSDEKQSGVLSEEPKLSEIFASPFLLYPCVAFALWDAVTTAIGTIAILNGTGVAYVGAGLVTCFTTAILMSSFKLLKIGPNSVTGAFVRVLFILVIFYDLYTSFYGAKFATFSGLEGQTEQVFYETSFAKWMVVLMLTLLSVSATMICSWIYHERTEGTAG